MQIEQILSELGIKYNISGHEAWTPCMFHGDGVRENHPSFSVSLKNGTFYCFSCGAKGNLAYLVSRIKDIPYPQAVIYVNEKIGWARADKWREDYENKNFAPPTFKITEADMALFTDVPEKVLARRHVEPGYAKKFKVRWNSKNESWILPIRDPYSYELWGWQEKYANVRNFRNYPAGIRKSQTLFGLDAFADGSTAILVESPIDAVRVSSFGKGSGLACSGLQISNTQLSLVFERSDNVVLALDSDNPGIQETARICAECKGRAKIWVFSYEHVPRAKDPGEMDDIEVSLGFENMKSGLRWMREYEKNKTRQGRSS